MPRDTPEPLLRVEHLAVSAHGRRGHRQPIVNDIGFSVAAGKVLALIGESGSGKTTISLACMGYARAGCVIDRGDIYLGSTNVLALNANERRNLRGKDIAYVAQSAAAAFNSALTINQQVIETSVIKGLLNTDQAIDKAVSLYRELDLPQPESIGNRYPHQVSGGQLQRLMAAMAMICDPALLILDEPTTALDVTTQIEVLRAFKRLIRHKRTSAIYVSHDLAVVAQIADHILVLKDGAIVEIGTADSIIHDPQDDYTRQLIDAAHVMPKTLPQARPMPAAKSASAPPLLKVNGVSAGYGRAAKELVLRNVDLEAFAGRTVGVIGESGSGKTSLGRVITGLMAPSAGNVTLLGQTLDAELGNRSKTQLRSVQFAFQMADVALNPRHRIGKIIGRPLAFYFGMPNLKRQQRTAELLSLVELPSHYVNRYPRELSGGERQRVNLARALAAEPKLIICDEVTSALDTVVAEAILTLLKTLQARLDIGYVFISHDLSTVAKMADTIAVMRHGEVVEYGTTQSILSPPHHAYTRLLLDSVPDLRTDWLDQLTMSSG